MKKYYIHDGNNQDGPFSIEELKQLGLKPNDMIWYEGLGDWKEANNIPALKSILSSPPPFKKTSPPPFQKKSNSNSYLKYIGLIVLLMGGLLFYINQPTYNYNPTEYEKSTVKEAIKDIEMEKKKAHYKKNMLSILNPHPNNYKKNLLLGGIEGLAIKIDNKTPFFIEKVGVEISYIKGDGSVYQRRSLYFSNLEPGTRQILEAPSSDKGVEVRCEAKYVYCEALELLIRW